MASPATVSNVTDPPGVCPPTGLTGLRRTLRRTFDSRAIALTEHELSRSAIVFAPHQDDETLGCGGTILKKRACGAEVAIVFLTDGRQSHADRTPVDQLVTQRREEGIAAASALGVAESAVLSLGFEDGSLRDYADAARSQVEHILRERDPAEVYVTYQRDGAPDHVAASDIVNESIARVCPRAVVYEYPIWYWAYWPFARRGDLSDRGFATAARSTARSVAALRRERLVRVSLDDVRETKWAALQLHATQVQRLYDDPDWPTLGDVWEGGFLSCFFDAHELFIRRDATHQQLAALQAPMKLDIVSLSLLGWIPVCASLFLFFRPIRALTLAYLIGWLLLPVDTLALQGFWDVDKILATNVGVIAGTALFCPSRFKCLRFGAPEWILLIYAGGTCITSLSNQLGIYDGVSSFVYRLSYTAVPFSFGRAFVRSRADLLEIARIVVYGASIYAVLAIWEWRMSPQIHKTLYGYFQHSFHQHMRWGFFRPIVCFKHALGLGTFFAWTALLAITMYRAGELRPIMGVPPVVYVVLPLIALLACMSFGPWGLFAIGILAYVYRSQHRWRWMIWMPLFLAVGWMGGRYTGALDGAWADSAIRKVSEKRADSLKTRVDAETLLLEKAQERPVFGWGSWGRNRVIDRHGKDLAVTDGMWVLLVGMYGLAGLTSFYLWWCWPIIMSRRAKSALADDPVVFPILIAVGLQAVNLLFNGFLSPILTLTAGGVVTAMYAARRSASAPQAARAAYPASSYADRVGGVLP